jgi:hypothetical protein
MKTISLKFSASLDLKLNRAAKRGNTSRSEVVRAALELFLNAQTAVPVGSLLEACTPWIGCVEGPGDLSTNPKYLKGFGK